jgi:hypothetical protein
MAQTVSTTPRHHFYQNNGELAAGGTLEIFDANTITHAVTWFDRDGTVAHQNANPLTLDSQGAAVIWLDAGKVYDWIARDALGNIIDNAQGITGSTSAISSSSQWIVTAMTPTFVNTRTFTLVGDQTSVYSVGRRVRVTLSGGFKYATILSSVFSTVTTVTLGFSSASDVLDATLSAVDVGLDVASSPSLQVGIGSVIDLTGYTGADVSLQVGQSAVYDVAAITSHLLRIATGDKQKYSIDIDPELPTAGNGAATFLSVNNTTLAASIVSQYIYGSVTTATASQSTTDTRFVLDGGGATVFTHAIVSTNTKGKTCDSRFMGATATVRVAGSVLGFTPDTTTAWTSLGTLTMALSTTGRITVKRMI